MRCWRGNSDNKRIWHQRVIYLSKLFLSASHGKNALFKYDEFIGFTWQYTNSITLDSYISTNSIKNIELADPNWEVVNYILDVAEFWVSDMDIDLSLIHI